MLLDFLRKAIPVGRGAVSGRRADEPYLLDTVRSSSAPQLRVAEAIARIKRQPLPSAILVPIHNAAPEVEACIAALLAHTPGDCRMILLEDASPDPAVDAVLSGYRHHPAIEIHRNATNLGFTRTVNLGIEIAGRADVVLLNSDTKVTPRWLENLRLAAYSGDRVATATPVSNNAGAFSVPEFGKENPLPPWLGLDDYARLVTQSSARSYPQVPTGNGFCMYIRRDCLDQVGGFDAAAFPRGYGEENDFCMRAGFDGWSHVIDDATLIYHVRSASFGEEKAELVKHSRAVLDRRYPDYAALARRLETSPEFRSMRDRIATALAGSAASGAPVRPRILVAEPSATNGVEPGVPALANGAAGAEPILLSSNLRSLELRAGGANGEGRLLEAAAIPEGVSAGERDAHYEAVVGDWLAYHAIETAHVAVSTPHCAPLRSLCERLGIPTVLC